MNRTDIEQAVTRLKQSERGVRALDAFKVFSEALWSLDTENKVALATLIEAHYQLPGSLSEALDA